MTIELTPTEREIVIAALAHIVECERTADEPLLCPKCDAAIAMSAEPIDYPIGTNEGAFTTLRHKIERAEIASLEKPF
jgi:hypothetical protein